jgi:multidrug efflux pump subunit AcrB
MMRSIIKFFAESKLTPLLILAAIMVGVGAVVALPREEEPQIRVPMVDVFINFPGGTAKEVQKRVIELGERKLWEVPDVEYIYTQAMRDQAVIIMRFKVGTVPSESLISSYAKVMSNYDLIPAGFQPPLVKPRSIDDVPFLTLTFSSKTLSPIQIRSRVAELRQRINAIPNISETNILGGRREIYLIEPNLEAMVASGVTLPQIRNTVLANNQRATLGDLPDSPSTKSVLELDGVIDNPEDLANLVVGIYQGRAVRLSDVATVRSSPDQHKCAVFNLTRDTSGPENAVTLTLAKRAGSNATSLAEEVLNMVRAESPELLGDEISMEVTRDYGHTAAEKANELLWHMLLAILGVSALIAWALGWRAAGVVAIAIPTTLAITLGAFYLLGYTLNRITLFALIFTIGILVDDPIVGVENIVRFLRTYADKFKDRLELTTAAMMEILSPLVLATVAVIAAIMPMAFVGGLMGPYMRPIPVGASIAMVVSMLVALTVTPWAAIRILKLPKKESEVSESSPRREDVLTRFYRWSMGGLLSSRRVRWLFIGSVALLLVGSFALVGTGAVKLKMLPFDNKSEFQVTLDMPAGTTLGRTTDTLKELSARILREEEVSSIQLYAGVAAPYNFNGLVRHSFLKNQTNQAELQVTLAPKDHRTRSSHAIAESLRGDLNAIAHAAGGYLQVAEIPPGPPVQSTIVVEVYGPDVDERLRLASHVEEILNSQSGLTDMVNLTEKPQTLRRLNIDSAKASLNGIALRDIASTLAAAVGGEGLGYSRVEDTPEPVAIMVRLSPADRADEKAALGLTLYNRFGRSVPLGDLVSEESRTIPPTYHGKNLLPVNYINADVSDSYGSPVYAMVELNSRLASLTTSDGQKVGVLWTHAPVENTGYAFKWDGEWQITYEVFRDLGIAFAAVLVLIFILVVGWFKSFRAPIVIMSPIPLSLIGILPAHAMAGIFFTATSMIGFIAGAGIVVRNAIILVDFIHLKLAEGLPLKQAVVEAGALRFRPMLLTAAAVVIGASVLLTDPIFQGLALSLIAGEVASTIISRTTVPLLFYRIYRKDYEK